MLYLNVSFWLSYHVVTRPESIQLIPFIQSIAKSNNRIRTQFRHGDQIINPLDEQPQIDPAFDKDTVNALFQQLEASMKHTKNTEKAIDLDYLKEVYNSINTQMSSSMMIKDDSVEMDLVTFRCRWSVMFSDV